MPETPRSSIWTERVLAHLKRSKQVRSSVSAATMAKPPPVVTGPPTPIQNPLPRLPRVDKKGVTSIFTKIAENSIQPKLHATPAPRPAHRPMYRASLRQANPPPNPSHPTVPLRVAQSTGTAPPRQDNIMVPLYIPANLVNSVLECLAGQAQPTMPFPRTEACIPVEIIRQSSGNLRTPPVASPFAAGRSSAIHSTPKAHSEQTGRCLEFWTCLPAWEWCALSIKLCMLLSMLPPCHPCAQMQHRQLWWVRGLGRKQAAMPGLPDSTSLHGNPNRRLSPSQVSILTHQFASECHATQSAMFEACH